MISSEELSEVFPNPSVREVAFEVRFAPRLRVGPEVWRIQDKLADAYPEITEEGSAQPDGRIVRVYIFSDPVNHRLIKISQENFATIFNSYTRFEDFKTEAISRTNDFAELFEVKTYHRAGLRYVNHIELSSKDGIQLLRKYINVPIDFQRFEESSIEQLLTEFRLKAGKNKLTIRGALIQLPTKIQELLYILDLDCYSSGHFEPGSLPTLLEEFHKQIQVEFLRYVTEEYKTVMRRKP